MRNLLNFLERYNNTIVFLILEGIAIFFLATGNSYHNSRFVNGIRGLTYGFDERINNTRTYLNLREINRALAVENVRLRNSLDKLEKRDNSLFFSVNDTIYNQQFVHTSAEAIDNSANRQKNFFTLNKGRLQGVAVDMAVTSEDGVAGVIVGCSENYSVAMSLLNLDFKLSDIPQDALVSIGDTIQTTGYSAIFPEGIMVGTVTDFEKLGGDFYKITVNIKTNFKKLHFVDIIGNLKKSEVLQLEKTFQ